MFLGFVVGYLLLWGIIKYCMQWMVLMQALRLFSIILFVVAWIGQFIGHKIEKKPSFLDDLQFY